MELISPEQFSEWLERWGKWCLRDHNSLGWAKKSMTGMICETMGDRVDGGKHAGITIEEDPIAERIESLVSALQKIFQADAEALQLKHVFKLSNRKAAQKMKISESAFRYLVGRAEHWLHGAMVFEKKLPKMKKNAISDLKNA
ncbi:antiterminator Q family protein [Magnetococcales bacterium HHB-1]